MSVCGSWSCSNGPRDQREKSEGGCMYLLIFIVKLELNSKKRKASNVTEERCDKLLTLTPRGCSYLQTCNQTKNSKKTKP